MDSVPLYGLSKGFISFLIGYYSTGGSEEIPLIQGKEHWLRFAGAAMKRYPMSKVRETQVRR